MASIDRLEFTGEDRSFSLYAGKLLLPRQQIIGVGIDRCDIPRIMADIQEYPSFINENFSPEEIIEAEKVKRLRFKAQRYAGKFAGKEAVFKALGEIANPAVPFKDVSVLKRESGQPYVVLLGNALRHAQSLGVTEVLISLTHEKDTAMAFCVALGMRQQPARC